MSEPEARETAAQYQTASQYQTAAQNQTTSAHVETGSKPRKKEQMAESSREARWLLKRNLAELTKDIEVISKKILMIREKADESCATPELTDHEKALMAEKHSKRVAEAQKRSVSTLLRDMMTHKHAHPFKAPVDTKLYKDYLSRVQKPMDFGTVKTRLDTGQYVANVDSFVEDMRQIFKNAYLYNAEGTDVYVMAKQLDQKFEDRIKGVFSKIALAENESCKEEDEIRQGAQRRMQDKALYWLVDQRKQLEGTLTSLETRILELKSEAAARCTFMPLTEKQSLAKMMEELSNEDMEVAMQLVVNRHPATLSGNCETLDLDLGSLDSLTLRQLMAFTKFCRSVQKPESPRSWPGLAFGAGIPGVKAKEQAAHAHDTELSEQPLKPASPRAEADAPKEATPDQPPAKRQRLAGTGFTATGNTVEDAQPLAGSSAAAAAGPEVVMVDAEDIGDVAAFEMEGLVKEEGRNMTPDIRTRTIGERTWSELAKIVPAIQKEAGAGGSKLTDTEGNVDKST